MHEDIENIGWHILQQLINQFVTVQQHLFYCIYLPNIYYISLLATSTSTFGQQWELCRSEPSFPALLFAYLFYYILFCYAMGRPRHSSTIQSKSSIHLKLSFLPY